MPDNGIENLSESITKGPSPEDEKLKKLIEKEEKSTRKVGGIWHWASMILMAAMVLIYFYSSGISPISAQLHRGIYVLLTYALVFILYPLIKRIGSFISKYLLCFLWQIIITR